MSKKKLPKYDEDAKERYLDIKRIKWRTKNQEKAYNLIENNLITFLIGEAGTSKTLLSVLAALSAYNRGEVDKIVLTRATVEASNSLGYLPGNQREKTEIYMMPMIQQINFLMGEKGLEILEQSGALEIVPIQFARGLNFHNTFLIIDEGQNCQPLELKLLLTRLGDNSKAVITLDPTQIDLTDDIPSIADDGQMARFANKEGIGIFEFGREDIVRSKLCKLVLSCYDDEKRQTKTYSTDKY